MDDCTPPRARVLAPGSDETLSPEERVAKRRRIEKLVDGLLNGKTLTIESARVHPQSLKAIVEWNERSRTGQKFTLPAAEDSAVDPEMWADVDDPLDTYQHQSTKAKKRYKSVRYHTKAEKEFVTRHEPALEEQANSACYQARHTLLTKMCAGQNADIFEQAPTRQDRSLRRQATEEPLISAAVGEATAVRTNNSGPNSRVMHWSYQEPVRNIKRPKGGKDVKSARNNIILPAELIAKRHCASIEPPKPDANIEMSVEPSPEVSDKYTTPFIFRKTRAEARASGTRPSQPTMTPAQIDGKRGGSLEEEDSQPGSNLSEKDDTSYDASNFVNLDMSLSHDSFGVRLDFAHAG